MSLGFGRTSSNAAQNTATAATLTKAGISIYGVGLTPNADSIALQTIAGHTAAPTTSSPSARKWTVRNRS